MSRRHAPDLDVIESELRLIAAVPRTAAEVGAPAPRIGPVDQLLDEWNELRAGDEGVVSSAQ
jgi:hypothetical protein